MERFIINDKSKKIHDRKNLKENCNTDQIANRWETDDIQANQLVVNEGYSYCGWCR